MRVLNVMLSSGLGGLEFASVSYAYALKEAGFNPICCVAPDALIIKELPSDIEVISLPHSSQYDPRAILKAHRIITSEKPDIIIVHGRRAFKLFVSAMRLTHKKVPIIKVIHGPRLKNIDQATHLITVSNALKGLVIDQGIAEHNVTHIPNFLVTRPMRTTPLKLRSPAVIGVFGRLVHVKGIDLFLEALAILKNAGVDFEVMIGGAGEDGDALKLLADNLGISSRITWCGWVHDRDTFYNAIDIFCLPSRQESFGIVLLEAWSYGKPIISTRTSGAEELITHEVDGLLCDGNPKSMAAMLQHALAQPSVFHDLATHALETSKRYTLQTAALNIKEIVMRVHQEARTL